MPQSPPTTNELLFMARKLLDEEPEFKSLSRGNQYKLVSVDGESGYLKVLFESGRVRRLLVDELCLILKELYRVKSIPRGYFRNPSNCMRVLGRKSWHAPGAAMFAILPKLDSKIRVDEKSGLILES